VFSSAIPGNQVGLSHLGANILVMDEPEHRRYRSLAQPAFAVKTAGSFETTFGAVENNGAFASDGSFRLDVVTNKTPPYNLSFIAEISSEATHASLSYIVLPRPHVGGAFLFELGASIAPVTLDGASFDHLRAYCSIRMP